ncbi:hypothetical protein [Flagellimonas sp. 2504JD4-2]
MSEDKDLEKLIHKLLDEAPLDSPSDNFTEMVVAKVEAVKTAKLTFKPLITKRAFLLWTVVLGGLAFYLLTSDTAFNADIGTYLSTFSETNSWISDKLGQLQLSKKMIYTIGSFGVMLYFQTVLLKRFFNRRPI